MLDEKPLRSSSASLRSVPAVLDTELYPPLLRKKSNESNRSMIVFTSAMSRALRLKSPLQKEDEDIDDNLTGSTHTRSRSLTSLHQLFSRQRRPSVKRSHSQLSNTSNETTTTNKSKSLIRFMNFFPLKSNSNKTSPPTQKHLLSQKSLEFEALLEQYPSRTIKTSLTPCTAA